MPPKKIDTKVALKMKLKGATLQEIGDKFGVTRSSVQQHLKPLLTMHCAPQQLQEYQDKQADILDALSAGILAGIKKKDIAKASLQQKVSSMGVLIDKSRLIRGQSTNNSVSILLARHVHSLEVLPSARPVVIPSGEI